MAVPRFLTVYSGSGNKKKKVKVLQYSNILLSIETGIMTLNRELISCLDFRKTTDLIKFKEFTEICSVNISSFLFFISECIGQGRLGHADVTKNP